MFTFLPFAVVFTSLCCFCDGVLLCFSILYFYIFIQRILPFDFVLIIEIQVTYNHCNCILYFLKSTLTILTKSIGLTNSCQRYRIVPACAGVCSAYLIVHLKCTRKSSKMLSEGISSILSFLQFQIIICSLIFLSFFRIVLPYCLFSRLHYLS